MKKGRTIVAERERPVVESERMQERKRQRTRRFWRAAAVIGLIALVIWLMIMGVGSLVKNARRDEGEGVDSGYASAAKIVDETGAGVTSTMRNFIGRMEKSLAEYGYKLERAVLPQGKMRQVNLYLAGRDGYIKVRNDRGVGVQTEDIDRMIKYLGEQKAEYIDVRVEGKAYWK